MPARLRPRLSYANVMATVAVVLALGGGAYAAASFVGPGGQIQACVSKKGQLTVLQQGKHCKKGKRPIAWNNRNAANADRLDQLDSTDFQRSHATAGGALVGAYPAPGLKPSEPWNEVGDANGPPFTVVPGSCLLSGTTGPVRANYDGGYSTAAFYRDPLGVVHLKGVTKRIDDPYGSDCDQVFSLPVGYRPAQREIHPAVGYNGSDYVPDRIDVTPLGQVVVKRDGGTFDSLDGLNFRCAPSGQNGCP